MPTTNGNRKILDVKRWEFMAPSLSASGLFGAACRHVKQSVFGFTSATAASIYWPDEDGWTNLASPALGSFAAGACIASHTWSTGSTVAAASLTATGGSTSTIVTNQNLQRDLRGYRVHILSGPNAGVTLTISSNTLGATATITVPVQASAFTASTVYRLLTPRWYLFGGGTLAAGSFRVYDWATNAYASLSTTGLPASFGTDGALVSTPSWLDSDYKIFATGTATSATATTIVQTGKTWTASQWINSQVRITGGTGAGQIRTITANTADTLTVATWTTTPDATSTYAIEGNDDFLYLLGNGAVAMYRYSISGNSWSTLSPVAARGGAPGAGMSGHWVSDVSATDWTSESAIINGRRIYSFRGGGAGTLDYYDIAANTWVAQVYSPSVETFTTGSAHAYYGDRLYCQKESTGRWFAYDFARADLVPWSTMLYPQSTAGSGSKVFIVVYIDGSTYIPYAHMVLNQLTIHLRQMVI